MAMDTYTDADFLALKNRVTALEASVAALTNTVNLLPTLAQVNTIVSALEDTVTSVQAEQGTLDVTVQTINRMLVAQGMALSSLTARVAALEA